MKNIKVGSDFSGVGAFNQALIRLGIDFEELFACDMDKYARQTFELNYGKPKDFPTDVYNREIPKESLDIFMSSPPCQAFSLAGKRKGEEDKRGILFYNTHEFIFKNNPRYFIIENVKGLLSDDSGKTFQRWIDLLSGKSVNGNTVIFPHEESVNYHVYYQVMNAKHYGIPQNRERVFIIGIRDDADNNFSFPKPFSLQKRLKDVLESEVDEKYFLSDNMINYLTTRKDNFNNGNINFKDENSVASTLTKSSASLDISDNIINLGNVNPSGNGMNGNVFSENGISPTLLTNKGEGIKIQANFGNKRLNETLNTKEIPNEDCIIDSYNKTTHTEICPSILTTINTANIHHVKIADYRADEGLRIRKDGNSPCITSSIRHTDEFKPKAGTRNPPLVNITNEPKIGAIRGRNAENPKSRQSGLETEQMLEINENGTSNALTTVQKDNVVIIQKSQDYREDGLLREYSEYCPTLRANMGDNHPMVKNILIPTNNSKGFDEAEEEEDSINFSVPSSKTRRGRVGKKVSQILDKQCNQGIFTQQRIRRLTPTECFRLMDFNEDMIERTISSKLISDSQLYKQAGNSICVGVLAAIINKLNINN